MHKPAAANEVVIVDSVAVPNEDVHCEFESARLMHIYARVRVL